jgi:hypothetical protein
MANMEFSSSMLRSVWIVISVQRLICLAHCRITRVICKPAFQFSPHLLYADPDVLESTFTHSYGVQGGEDFLKEAGKGARE